MQPRNKLLNQCDIFWVVTPCCFVDGYQRFGATFCLHIQGQILLLKVLAVISYETYAFARPRGFTFHSYNSSKIKADLVENVKTQKASSSNAPFFLNLGTTWSPVVRCVFQQLYPQGENPATH
jgi:hypothetical protein